MTGRLAPLRNEIQFVDAKKTFYESIAISNAAVEHDAVIDIDIFERNEKSRLGKTDIVVTAREIDWDGAPACPSYEESRRAPPASVLASARSALIAAQCSQFGDPEILQTRRRATTGLPPRSTLRVECLIKRASTYPLRMTPPAQLGFESEEELKKDESVKTKNITAWGESSSDPFEFTDILSKIWPDLFGSAEPGLVPATARVGQSGAAETKAGMAAELKKRSGFDGVHATREFGPPPFPPPEGPLPPLPSEVKQENSLLTLPQASLSEMFATKTSPRRDAQAKEEPTLRERQLSRAESPVLTGRFSVDALYGYF